MNATYKIVRVVLRAPDGTTRNEDFSISGAYDGATIEALQIIDVEPRQEVIMSWPMSDDGIAALQAR